MGRRSLLAAALWSLCLVASCFRPKDRCEISCDPAKKGADCPGNMMCLTAYHLCGNPQDMCPMDAASDPMTPPPKPDVPVVEAGPVDRPPPMDVVEAGTETNPEIPPDHPNDNSVEPPDGGVPERPPEVRPEVPEPPPDGGDHAETEEPPPPPPELPDAEVPDMRPDGDSGDTPDGGSDVPPPPPPPPNCHDEAEPPTMSCWNGHCLQLSQAVQDKMVLWLDPSNLGPVGSSVSTWCDQSGWYNDALAGSANPAVSVTGGLILNYGMRGAGLVVPELSSLDLGADDFTILMVTGFNHGVAGKTFFVKQGPASDFPQQLEMEWLAPPGADLTFIGFVNATELISSKPTGPGVDRVYGLRRVGDNIQLRVNGNIVNTTQLQTARASTDNSGDIYLGSRGGFDTETVDTIRAVIMIHGSLIDDDVAALEAWLLAAFGLS